MELQGLTKNRHYRAKFEARTNLGNAKWTKRFPVEYMGGLVFKADSGTKLGFVYWIVTGKNDVKVFDQVTGEMLYPNNK